MALHDDAAPVPPRNQFLSLGLVCAVFLALFSLNLWFFSLPRVEFVQNDISYYSAHLHSLVSDGDASVMTEYPMPAVWILRAIYWIGGGWESWQPWFMMAMVLLTAAVAATLYRTSNIRPALFWILFIGACGPIVWFRFDLIPAALVAWACLWLTTHPRVSGAMIALGAAVKLWPALFALPMAAPNPLRPTRGRERAISFLVVGFLLGLASLFSVGWERSVSPLVWQSDRGLQMESVPATPLMFLRTFTHSSAWELFLSDFNAIEVRGPGVGLMLGLSTLLTTLALGLTLFLTWRLIRHHRRSSERLSQAILFSILAILSAMIVANKTLSPQYILWFGGPLAALFLHEKDNPWRRHVRIQAAGLLIVAVLTQYSYPWATYGIMAEPNSAGPETSMLILRNLLLLVLLGHAVLLAWWSSGPAAARESGDSSLAHSVSFQGGGPAT